MGRESGERAGRWPGTAGAGGGKGTIGVRIEISPSPERLARTFREFATEIRDLRPAWEKLVPIAIDEERRIFASHGVALDGEQWRPLSPGYARWRSFRKGKRRKSKRALRMFQPVNVRSTLVLTGRLFGKLTRASAARISASAFRFGVYNLPYARAVQFGHGRWFIGVSARLKEAATAAINEHVSNMIDRISVKSGMSRAMIIGVT
jgi:hypothetical protein